MTVPAATPAVLRNPFGAVRSAWARLGAAELGLVIVLLGGTGLRIWLIHAWRPAFLGYPDSAGYIAAARLKPGGLLFWNPYRPAGYPLFLSFMHGLHDGLAFVIDAQHLMGLAIVILVYLSLVRFVRHRWVALLPAAVVAFSGSELYLEHALLSETLYTLLVVAALWCAAHAVGAGRRPACLWLAAAGVLFGCSGPVRSVGVVVALALIAWAGVTGVGYVDRVGRAAAVTAAFALALGGYLVYQHSTTHSWDLTHTTGETLYARAAVFADCHDFTPPAGTRALCPPAGAPAQGATWYMFAGQSPLISHFGEPPDPRNGGSYNWVANPKAASFALAAVVHQPWDYLWTTVQGLVKYVAPNLGSPTMLEWSQTPLITSLEDPGISGQVTPELAAYYPTHPVVHHDIRALNDYAIAARVEGPVTALLIVLMLAGFLLTDGPRRTAAGLFGSTTAVMMIAPVALLFYGVRYATPAYGPLAAAAAIGLDAGWDRWGSRARRMRPGHNAETHA